MFPHPPKRLLFLRPDAYGDLFLFEPVPRLVRHFWPEAEIGVLVRAPYADALELLAWEGVRGLTTTCNPYRQGPGIDPAALAALRETVQAFAPDCVVAACAEQTWLEAAVGAFLPAARQVSLGFGITDPAIRAALDAVFPVDWAAIYPERIPLVAAECEWEKNLRVAGALLGQEVPRWWPLAQVPADARDQAASVLAENGLEKDNFVVCAAAGTANVRIKSWPAAHYGETLAWLEQTRGIKTLLIGHESERETLEAVRAAALVKGVWPALWLGRDGEMPVVAGLLNAARFYFGNDTGAVHLAAALGKPVVPIFGGGHWPRFQPVARHGVTVVQPLSCFGCAWECYYADAPCVRTISPDSVRHALTTFLDSEELTDHSVFEAGGLDTGARALINASTPRLRFLRHDSSERLRQVERLGFQLRASEADRDARGRQVEELTALLETSEADRDARGRQVEELTALLETSEADRDARGRQVEELTPLLQASEADRDARGEQVKELLPLLRASEADRDARGRQVEELTALLETSEADRDARGRQVEELTPLLQASEADRQARFEQIEQLTTWLLESQRVLAALSNPATAESKIDDPTLSASKTGSGSGGEAREPKATPNIRYGREAPISHEPGVDGER